jgi:hypothetical protein
MGYAVDACQIACPQPVAYGGTAAAGQGHGTAGRAYGQRDTDAASASTAPSCRPPERKPAKLMLAARLPGILAPLEPAEASGIR